MKAIIIFYKGSSENRFFSKKVSLAWKFRNYGSFFVSHWLLKTYKFCDFRALPMP